MNSSLGSTDSSSENSFDEFDLKSSQMIAKNKNNSDQKEHSDNSKELSSSDENNISISGFIKKNKNGKLIDKPFDAGKLTVVFASMCAGKTTAAIGYANKMTILGLKTCYVKYEADYRTAATISSFHDSGKMNLDAKIDVVSSNDIFTVFDSLLKYTVIVIDEGQFFNDITLVEKLILEHKKLVFVASLDADANLKRMGKVHKIIHLCAPGCLTKLAANCLDCAAQDHRFEDAGFSFSLHGTEKFVPLCLKHHQNRSSKQDKN